VSLDVQTAIHQLLANLARFLFFNKEILALIDAHQDSINLVSFVCLAQLDAAIVSKATFA
jgi:hypothetical protein